MNGGPINNDGVKIFNIKNNNDAGIQSINQDCSGKTRVYDYPTSRWQVLESFFLISSIYFSWDIPLLLSSDFHFMKQRNVNVLGVEGGLGLGKMNGIA